MSATWWRGILGIGFLVALPAMAGPLPSVPRSTTEGMQWNGFGASGSVPWSIVVLLTVLTLLPALLLSMTPFVRLLVVNILNQTGISALAQANQMQQGVLSLLR